jgi:hypothetical protein
MARSRRSLVPSLVALGLVAVGLPAVVPTARADDGTSLRLETVVPGRTLAFAAMEDIGSWGGRWKQTALAKLFADPDMRAFMGPLEEDVNKMLEGGDGKEETPLPPEAREVFKQLQGLSGQAAVALVAMPEGRRMPVMAAGLDFGSHLSDFVTFLERMKARQDDMPLKIEEKDGKTWWTLGDPERPDMVGTTLGGSVLMSTDRAWVDDVVARKGAAVDGSLATNASFQTSRKAAGDGTAMFVFGNVPALLDRFVPGMPPEAPRVMKALGIDTMRGLSYAFGFHGDVFRETVVLDAPASEEGVMSLLRTEPIDRKGLAMAPSTAFLFAESSFPLSRMLKTLRPILQEVDADLPQHLDKALADAKAATGVDLEKDLLPMLSDDLSYYVGMPETGGLYPELVVSFGVKDPAAFEQTAQKAVDGLLQTVGKDEGVTGRQRMVEWHGKRLYMVELAGVRRRDMVPFTPTWAVLDGRWVVTLVPHAMKELILRTEQGGKGLADQDDVRSILRGVPEKATSLGYVDLQAFLTLLYDTGVPLLQTVAKPNVLQAPVRLDWAMLPPTRAVRPYLRSMGTHTHVAGDAFVMQVDSPIGYVLPIAIVAGAAGLALGRRSHAMVTEMPDFTDDSRGTVADLQVQSYADAVRGYHAAHGKLPGSLEQLTQETDPGTGRPWVDRVRRDPWGGEYMFLVLDAAKGTFEVRSAGADGTPNTLDDVVHPTDAERDGSK